MEGPANKSTPPTQPRLLQHVNAKVLINQEHVPRAVHAILMDALRVDLEAREDDRSCGVISNYYTATFIGILSGATAGATAKLRPEGSMLVRSDCAKALAHEAPGSQIICNRIQDEGNERR
jgi:hypothetical protein